MLQSIVVITYSTHAKRVQDDVLTRSNVVISNWALPSFEERVLAGLRLCLILLSCFFSCSSMKSSLIFQGERILALLLPFCFYRKPRGCCLPLWSIIARVSDCTNDVVSQSFPFLIGWMRISFEIYEVLFCTNLSMYEINEFYERSLVHKIHIFSSPPWPCNILYYNELFDQSDYAILILISGNYTNEYFLGAN